MIDLLTFPGWIALWAAIVLALAAFSALAVSVIVLVERAALALISKRRRDRDYWHTAGLSNSNRVVQQYRDSKESAAPANLAAAKASPAGDGPTRAKAPSAARANARGGATRAERTSALRPSPSLDGAMDPRD